jgi:hypothetical protein
MARTTTVPPELLDEFGVDRELSRQDELVDERVRHDASNATARWTSPSTRYLAAALLTVRRLIQRARTLYR